MRKLTGIDILGISRKIKLDEWIVFNWFPDPFSWKLLEIRDLTYSPDFVLFEEEFSAGQDILGKGWGEFSETWSI